MKGGVLPMRIPEGVLANDRHLGAYRKFNGDVRTSEAGVLQISCELTTYDGDGLIIQAMDPSAPRFCSTVRRSEKSALLSALSMRHSELNISASASRMRRR